MVFINEVKYACERCIRGHRVSGCSHTNATLKRIKRKGRPTGQCSACRANKVRGQKPCNHTNGKHNDSAHLNNKSEDGKHFNSSNPASPVHGGSINTFSVSGASPSKSPGSRDRYHFSNSLEQELPEEISPEALKTLSKEDPNIIIELPDGSFLNDAKSHRSAPQSAQQHGTSKPSYDGAYPNGNAASESYIYPYYQNYPYNAIPGRQAPSPSPSPVPNGNFKLDEAALSNSMPHSFNHLNVIAHRATPQSQEDIFNPTSQPITPPPFMLNGPYNAALYNDSMGNNAASAAINLHGTGNYMSNTNPYSHQNRAYNVPTPSLNYHLHGYHPASGVHQQNSSFPSYHTPANYNAHQPMTSEQYSYGNNGGYYGNNHHIPNAPYDSNGGLSFMNSQMGGYSTPEQISRTSTPSFLAGNPSFDTPQEGVHNDLYSSKQELASSLPGIGQMNPQMIPTVSKEDEQAVKSEEAEEAYATSSLPQLSNLY